MLALAVAGVRTRGLAAHRRRRRGRHRGRRRLGAWRFSHKPPPPPPPRNSMPLTSSTSLPRPPTAGIQYTHRRTGPEALELCRRGRRRCGWRHPCRAWSASASKACGATPGSCVRCKPVPARVHAGAVEARSPDGEAVRVPSEGSGAERSRLLSRPPRWIGSAGTEAAARDTALPPPARRLTWCPAAIGSRPLQQWPPPAQPPSTESAVATTTIVVVAWSCVHGGRLQHLRPHDGEATGVRRSPAPLPQGWWQKLAALGGTVGCAAGGATSSSSLDHRRSRGRGRRRGTSRDGCSSLPVGWPSGT